MPIGTDILAARDGSVLLVEERFQNATRVAGQENDINVLHDDGSIAALLGASPGASTAVSIMLELLARCFPERWASAPWQGRVARLVPSARIH